MIFEPIPLLSGQWDTGITSAFRCGLDPNPGTISTSFFSALVLPCLNLFERKFFIRENWLANWSGGFDRSRGAGQKRDWTSWHGHDANEGLYQISISLRLFWGVVRRRRGFQPLAIPNLWRQEVENLFYEIVHFLLGIGIRWMAQAKISPNRWACAQRRPSKKPTYFLIDSETATLRP